jgi:hypothetical protein
VTHQLAMCSQLLPIRSYLSAVYSRSRNLALHTNWSGDKVAGGSGPHQSRLGCRIFWAFRRVSRSLTTCFPSTSNVVEIVRIGGDPPSAHSLD